MSLAFGMLVCGFLAGFLAMFVGVVYANYAVQQMRIVLNESRPLNHQMKWHDAIQRVAQSVIDAYRNQYPDGTLSRKLTYGYYLAGIGGAVGIASACLMKFVN